MASKRARALGGSLLIPLCTGLTATAGPRPDFTEIAGDVGIEFRHWDGRSGRAYFIETAASGGGWIDFDGDGDLDLYLINGAATPGSRPGTRPTNRLFENRGRRFVDVTETAGVGDTGYGMGMCAGDYDGDDRPDIMVTNFGADRLYRNLGDGTFEEVAASAGVDDPRWGTGCAFADIDSDGDLDLYVAHYVAFSFDDHPKCGDPALGRPGYCPPRLFDGVPDSLFINQGDGTFREEGALRGLAQGKDEKGFGALMSDLDGDGDPDIYVTNDGTANRFYRNDGRGRFKDESLLSGTGLNRAGQPEAGMGVDSGDLDGDCRFDLLVTNYSMETNTLYRNLGDGFFVDRSTANGIARPSYLNVGWGVQLFDYDNDGDLDLAVANGHVQDGIEKVQASLRYAQENQLFENLGDGQFREVTESAGSGWTAAKVSRGLAAGDWNSDGRVDLLVTNTNDSPDLLENRTDTSNHWLGLQLRGPTGNRDAIGAQVTLKSLAGIQVREQRSGAGFLSQADPRLHFGLGSETGPVEIVIRWPDGSLQREKTERLDRYWLIEYRDHGRETPETPLPGCGHEDLTARQPSR